MSRTGAGSRPPNPRRTPAGKSQPARVRAEIVLAKDKDLGQPAALQSADLTSCARGDSSALISAGPAPGVRFSDTALARQALHAALSVDGVAGPAVGGALSAVTYGLAGQAVRGIKIRQDAGACDVEIHLIARMTPLAPLAARVRREIAAALSDCVPCRRIDIFIDDLEDSA